MDSVISLASVEANTIYHYCILASAVMLFYDFIITLEAEFRHVWRRRVTAVTFLFLLNRYLNLALSTANLFTFLPYIHTVGVHCEYLCIFTDVLQILSDLNSAVFGALRVWAIWDRKWVIFVTLLIVCLVTPLLNIYRISTTTFDVLPNARCNWTSYLSSAARFRVTIAIQVAGILADSLIFCATLFKALKIQGEARKVGLRPAFTTIILQQGLLWWLLLVVVGIVPLVVNQLNAVVNPANFFVSVMHSVMLSRFILSLRDLDDPHGSYRKQNPPTDTLDELGGPLKSYDDEDDADFIQLEDYDEVGSSPTVTSVRFAPAGTEEGSSRRWSFVVSEC